jgi:2-hydroxychromene-2-carboxylate isomerase
MENSMESLAARGAGTKAGPVIEMWFDFASPYSFLAMERIESVAAAANVRTVYQPFLLGPIFQQRGWNDSPFRLFPDKGEYMMREVARLAAKYGIAYSRPTAFPRLGVLAARAALLGLQEDWGKDFCRNVFRANFVRDMDLQEPMTLTTCLDALGVDPPRVMAYAVSDPGRQALRAQVERAQGLGIFGAPMFFAGAEMFWGNDRLEDAVEWAVTHA